MSDLTDLEICQKIAEIEGVKVELISCSDGDLLYPIDGFDEYSPLTDDALCFQLMVKYGLEASPMIDGAWSVTQVTEYNIYGEPDYKLCQYGKVNPHLNKAICLVIIEANSNE